MRGAANAQPVGRSALQVAIRDVVSATPRTRILRLDLGGRSFQYLPGQAVFVGERGSDRRTPFSIAASPHDLCASGCLELLVRTDQPGVFPLTRQTELDVEGPIGSFTLAPGFSGRQLVFIAGGTGIAPVRAMIRQALSSVPAARVSLFYSARSRDEFPYQEELRDLAEEGRIAFWQTVTRETEDDGWTGHRGRITADQLDEYVADGNAVFFICGPLSMVKALSDSLVERGVEPARIVVDRWC